MTESLFESLSAFVQSLGVVGINYENEAVGLKKQDKLKSTEGFDLNKIMDLIIIFWPNPSERRATAQIVEHKFVTYHSARNFVRKLIV